MTDEMDLTDDDLHLLDLVDGDPSTGEHWATCTCGWFSGLMPNTEVALDAHANHITEMETP